MILSDLLEELRQKEIEISFSAGKLKYSGPEENISRELIEKLKLNKGKLLKYLWPKELSNLMPINPQGTKIPVFLVHGDNGNYIISDYLGSDQPVYGFFHPGSDGDGIQYKSVKEMASKYLEMLFNVYTAGPFYLIGFSFGGVVAFEMAIQLQKAGYKVPFLVLIDSIGPLATERFEWHSNFFSIIRYDILRTLRLKLKHELELFICNYYIFTNRPIPLKKRSYYLWMKYSTLTRKYLPSKFDGEILLFRTTKNPSTRKFLGWETIVSNIRIIEIEGEHLQIFEGKDRTDILKKGIVEYMQYVEGLNY
jgi:thioesterase domain-containing protein